MPEFFGPCWCDEYGNTFYPYIFKGTVSEDGCFVKPEEPSEFAEKWPLIATSYVAVSEDREPRQLSTKEVRAFVGAGRVSVRDA